jgi:rhamnogalacturonan endolyase
MYSLVPLSTGFIFHFKVQVNGGTAMKGGVFTTAEMGDDNAIARHGIHGLPLSMEFPINGLHLLQGDNTVYIKLIPAGQGGTSNIAGVIYDYIRLEGPSGYSNGGVASCGIPKIWMDFLFLSSVVLLCFVPIR